MIHAEISIYPIGTESTSISFYVARAVDALRGIKSVKYSITPMGTAIESEGMGHVLEAVREMTETVHRLGVRRVEVVLKIDSRSDKDQSLEDKVESVKKHL